MNHKTSILLAGGLVGTFALVACGGAAPEPKTPEPAAEDTSAADAEAAAAAEKEAAEKAKAALPPSAELSGSVLKLTLGGATYSLSESSIQKQGKNIELHFEQPSAEGDNQIWLVPANIKKGKPAKVEGTGMSAAFVQISKGKDSTRNVSSDCTSSGSVTFDTMPTPGKTAKGSVDVTITCNGVERVSAPLVIKGTFELPMKK